MSTVQQRQDIRATLWSHPASTPLSGYYRVMMIMSRPRSFRKWGLCLGKDSPFHPHAPVFSIPGTRSGSCLHSKGHKLWQERKILCFAFFKTEKQRYQRGAVVNIFAIRALTLVGNLGHAKHFNFSSSPQTPIKGVLLLFTICRGWIKSQRDSLSNPKSHSTSFDRLKHKNSMPS